jgi:hypothetical protein
MKSLAIVAVCAGLAAAPIVAKAADLVLFDAAGRPVAVLVPTAETAAPMMPTDIFAQQDAMLNRMMQTMTRMDAAFMSGPLSMDPAAFGNGQPGSTVITTSFSDGRSSCSRTVTYDQRGGGGSPIMQVRQTGDGCDALPGSPAGGAVPAALPSEPAPRTFTPAINPNSPQLIHVAYRHPVVKPKPRHF